MTECRADARRSHGHRGRRRLPCCVALAVSVPLLVLTVLAAVVVSPAAVAQEGGEPCVYRDARGAIVITDDLDNSPCRPAPRSAGFRAPGRLNIDFRTAELISLAHQLSVRHGVDHRLVESLVEMESGFDVRAVSRAGAMGLMQLMPAVARQYGVSDPFDPWQNLDGGIRHLRELLVRYGADLERTLAAYNAGSGAVDRYGGIPPYDETQNYVRRVLYRYRQRVQGLALH